nr:hypothetical protein Iba_chr06bCG11800 [Ipomoea batatas]
MEMDEQPMSGVKTERPRNGGGPSAIEMVAEGVTGSEWEEEDGSGGGGLVDESGASRKPVEKTRNPRERLVAFCQCSNLIILPPVDYEKTFGNALHTEYSNTDYEIKN